MGTWEDVINDLLDWEEENDQLLPDGWTPEQIALAESQGYVVDLETGELIPEKEADDYTVDK